MLLQLHIGTLARGLGSAMTGYQRGKREEEDYQRQAELEMLRQKLLTQQFTTAERAGKFAEAAERRAQERHQQQLDEAARKQQELEEDRARRIALGQHIRETGAFAGTPGADAELWARAAEAGELDLGDILTYYGRQRTGGGSGSEDAITKTAAFNARIRMYQSLLDEVDQRLKLAATPGSPDFSPERLVKNPYTWAEIAERVERENGIPLGTLRKTRATILSQEEAGFPSGLYRGGGEPPIGSDTVQKIIAGFAGVNPDTGQPWTNDEVRAAMIEEGFTNADADLVTRQR